MQKREVFAVHKRKLEEFLKKLELWKPLLGGELKCVICETTISLDNIGLVIPSGQDILLCCSNAECIFRTKMLQGESRHGT